MTAIYLKFLGGKHMTLYELGDQYKLLQHRIEEGEIPEEAIEDTLESIEGEFKHKTDNIACMIKNLEGESDLIKKEAESQLKRAASKKRKADRLKEYLKSQLAYLNIAKIETPRNCVSLKSNPAKLEIHPDFVNWAQNDNEDLLKYQVPLPNKTAIKAAIQSGFNIPYVEVKKTERLEIK